VCGACRLSVHWLYVHCPFSLQEPTARPDHLNFPIGGILDFHCWFVDLYLPLLRYFQVAPGWEFAVLDCRSSACREIGAKEKQCDAGAEKGRTWGKEYACLHKWDAATTRRLRR
jgi:hypothetical protein